MDQALVPAVIKSFIHHFRGHSVMLDSDLAELYQVTVKRLNEAVRRNSRRFPGDFMFQLTEKEYQSLRSQIATSKRGRGGRRYLPYAFTEQGVAMLSGVLTSDIAIEANINIMRAFVSLRKIYLGNQAMGIALKSLERRTDKNKRDIQLALTFLKEILFPPEKDIPKKPYRMGFDPPERKKLE